MAIIGALIVGLIAGALAKLFMPGKDPGGVLITIVLGIAGSVTAGILGRVLGIYRDSNSGPGIFASILGAMLLLFVYRAIVSRRATV